MKLLNTVVLVQQSLNTENIHPSSYSKKKKKEIEKPELIFWHCNFKNVMAVGKRLNDYTEYFQ